MVTDRCRSLGQCGKEYLHHSRIRVLESLDHDVEKSTFITHELEYLSPWIMTKDLHLLAKKVEVIVNLHAPRTVKQVCSFLGMVNYYHDMWN